MIDETVFKEFENFTFHRNFDFSKASTIGSGGIAKLAFEPQTLGELSCLVEKLRSSGIKYYVLGNLSNVLPPDGVLGRVIIKTTRFQDVDLSSSLFVSAGTTSGALLRVCRLLKKSGAEFLTGIPCTLGGALYMNAGVNGKYVAEIVESVIVLREGRKVELPLSECEYAYKSSVFMKNDDVILGAKLRLVDSSTEKIEEEIRFYARRRLHLPKGKSMGCVFKNPPNHTAGALIEGAGMKGLRFGGAVVSTEHANFILNDSGATSAQIKTLIQTLKNAVYAQYKIELKEEIKYLE